MSKRERGDRVSEPGKGAEVREEEAKKKTGQQLLYENVRVID